MSDTQEDMSKSADEDSHSGVDATIQDKDKNAQVDNIDNLDGDGLRTEGKVEVTAEGQAPKPSRKRTRQGRYISDISLDEVLELVHLPASVAYSRLGVGLTSFKRLCRSHGILMWPYKATPGKAAGNTATGQPRNVQQDCHKRDNLDRKEVVHTFDAYNSYSQLESVGIGNQNRAMQQQPLHPLECSQLQIPEEVLINVLLGNNVDPSMRTLLGMKLHLLKIMRFSETMKNEVGFTIIRDDIISSLYQLTSENPNETLTMY